MNVLAPLPEQLTNHHLKSLEVFPSGHARAAHASGVLCFDSVESLAQWLETGVLPRGAYQKFNEPKPQRHQAMHYTKPHHD